MFVFVTTFGYGNPENISSQNLISLFKGVIKLLKCM